jgi:molecular chaperone HscB
MELEFDDDPRVRAQVADQISALEAGLQTEIEPIFKSYDDQSVSQETLISLKNFYLKRRYLLRIKENGSKFAPH